MVKKLLQSFFAVMIVTASSFTADAASYITSNGIRYVYNSTKTNVSVTSLKSPNVYVGNIVIPEKITNSAGEEIPVVGVKSSAFSDCIDLISVTLPTSVTTIGDYAFDSCEKLESVNLESVETIGHWSFRNCYELKELSFGEKLQSIGNYCFDKNYKITTVSLPASVTNLGGYVFEGNPQLTTVYCYSENPPAIKKGYLDGEEIYTLFDDTDYSGRTLYVPEGCINNYKSQLGWNYFPEIKEFDASGVKNVTMTGNEVKVTTTGNGSLTISSNSATEIKIISINGQLVKSIKVNAGSTEVNGLNKGIYIINGAKVIVK